jgi:Antitoxin VbhA
MDDITAAKSTTPRISAEESERRRQVLRRADAHNRIEGICRDPATDAVFEAFVRGEIAVTDIVPRLKAHLSLR